MDTLGPDPARQLRIAHELIPRILGTGRAKTTLDVLVADPNLDQNSLALLSRIQWLNWHLADIPECAEMGVHLHVPEGFTAAREFLDALQVGYWLHEEVDVASPMAVRAAIVSTDCDIVLVRDARPFAGKIEKPLCIVTDDVERVLETVDVYARGFDVPWSSGFPIKDHPWSWFYVMADQGTFVPLLGYAETFQSAASAAQEALRVMIYNTLPNLYYGRDRLLFYQMQMRAAERAAYERQHFEFETAYHLNHFYLGMYSALDQAAIMANAFLNLGLAERDIGATYSQFRDALKRRSSVVHGLFTDADFKDLSARVNLLRHQAAHRRPLMPTRIVSESDPEMEMDEAELDEAMAALGWPTEAIQQLPAGKVRDAALATLRAKIRLATMETVAEQVVVVVDDGKPTHIVSPDPEGDFKKYVAFLNRLLKEMPAQTPGPMPPPTPRSGGARSGARGKNRPRRRGAKP